MLIINGNDESEFIQKSVDEFLKDRNLIKDSVAVEINGEILSKDEFCAKFKDGDKVEIVQFVGGG